MGCESIGISRKQVVFAVKETTCGTLKFPAAIDFIRPAGLGIINQVPDFVPSEELRNTLDILDEFQNQNPPGDWSVNMYVRPATTIGGTPQGDALYQSWQGSLNPTTAASLADAITAAATQVPFDGLSTGIMPYRGVIQICSEKIRYKGISRASRSATAGTLLNCTRGWMGTAATAATDNASMDLKSRFYVQTVESPSFSLWIKTDHFLQGLAGCTVNNAVLGVNNEGAVMVNMAGQGMKMVFAGKSAVAAGGATVGATLIPVDDAQLYSIDSRIYNSTDGDSNGVLGYRIVRVDTTGNNVAVATGISNGWYENDVVEGFLPTANVIGSPIESRYTDIYLDDISAKFRTTDFTFDLPKQYIVDEVGVDYPENYVEDMRNISSSLNLYFRAADAKYFTLGLNSYEIPIALNFGQDAAAADYRNMEVYFPRTKVKTPEISGDGPTLALSMALTALGTTGEDSAEIVFN